MGQVDSRLRIIEYAFGLCILLFCLGVIGFALGNPLANPLREYIGKRVAIQGVVDSVNSKPQGVQFVLVDKDYSVLVSTTMATHIAYGDMVSVQGVLTVPENFMTDQGTTFDYVSYLYKDNILYRMDRASVNVLSHAHGNWLVAHLIPVKDAIITEYENVLPPTDAELLAGINLGEKGGVSNAFRNDLITTGTIHIIALSGYNVTIVANFLRQVLIAVPRMSVTFANVCGALGIIFFVLLTGAQSSAIRAGVMALIALYAEASGNRYNAFRALVFAGFLMVLYNPRYIVYDVSFQLSFLATLGIMFVTPILLAWFVRVPEKILWIIPVRELMAATLGAQFGTLPFILYKTGNLSLIALPVNVVILPAVPYTMATGVIAGLLGSVSRGLAHPFILSTHWLLWYITTVIQRAAHVPCAALIFHNVPLWFCLTLYVILLLWVHRFWSKRDP